MCRKRFQLSAVKPRALAMTAVVADRMNQSIDFGMLDVDCHSCNEKTDHWTHSSAHPGVTGQDVAVAIELERWNQSLHIVSAALDGQKARRIFASIQKALVERLANYIVR